MTVYIPPASFTEKAIYQSARYPASTRGLGVVGLYQSDSTVWTTTATPEERLLALTTLNEQLSALLAADDYDDDFRRPTEAAGRAVSRLLGATASRMEQPIPGGHPSTLGDGGVTLEFDGDGRFVMVLIPPDGENIRIVGNGFERREVHAGTPEALARLLERLG